MKRILLSLILIVISIVNLLALTYTTNFPATENPISQGGNWVNGLATGLDWKNVRTTTNFAFGTQAGGDNGFDDSIAVLTGSWGATQTITATVRSVNQSSALYEEIELLLRFSITSHNAHGYELNFRCTHDGSQYADIVRWNGNSGDFTILAHKVAADGITGISDGDIVKGTISGSTITSYINNVQMVQVTDSTWSSGNPGLGFYLDLAPDASYNADFGYTQYSATDGISNGNPVRFKPRRK